MAVRVAKIDATSAVPVVELTVVEAPRCTAIGELSLPNAAEDGIKLGIADVEGVIPSRATNFFAKKAALNKRQLLVGLLYSHVSIASVGGRSGDSLAKPPTAPASARASFNRAS
jgi:hypothetical protein